MNSTFRDVLAGKAEWSVDQGNAFALPQDMTISCVDHVITDPPYTQRTSENARSAKGLYMGRDGNDGQRMIGFDGIDGDEARMVHEFIRIARRWVVLWCALEQIGVYAQAAGDEYVRGTVWRRSNSAPQFTGDRPGQACEGVVICHAKGRRKKWNRGGDSLYWDGPTARSEQGIHRKHPTPKPLWLMEDAIAAFTDPGDIVCDPFTGSGTTGVAARRLGRRFIGFERELEYVEMARQRIGETAGQPELFALEAFRREASSRRKQLGLSLENSTDGKDDGT